MRAKGKETNERKLSPPAQESKGSILILKGAVTGVNPTVKSLKEFLEK